ncbi:glycosyl hydrolase family 16 [Flavobacterium sp.]|uniref:glycosyl hydrolase family 16 n=1 Tax=Flavobacterium sp. TaxID=239 RepID=UPI00391C9C8F
MKNQKINYLKLTSLLSLFLVTSVSCERDLSDEATEATFAKTAEIFIDDFVGMGSDFYRPYGDSKFTAFSVDLQQGFESNSSIRIDVPNATDPEGTYAGGIFVIDGAGRNLTDYDALTFYVKASQGVTIGELGFGEDFGENKFITTITNVNVGTNWTKIIIPILDASKLLQERGMFRYAAGTNSTNGFGYTLWIDEIKFEKLGTNNLLYPFILNGEDVNVDGFAGANQIIGELGAVYNLANGQNVRVNAAPSYFTFNVSDTTIITPLALNNLGQMSTRIIGTSGSSVVTAQIGNTLAQGSLTINAVGEFPHAPVPTRAASSVVSLFSDAYTNLPVRHYNGFFLGSNTQGGAGNNPNDVDIQAPFVNGSLDNIIHYTQLDFVSFGMYETVPRVNISGMTHMHVDINVRQAVSPTNFIRIELHSSLANGPTTSSGSFVVNAATLTNVDPNGWASIDIPIASFPGFNDAANLGQVFFVSGNPGGIFNIWVDNVYFYAQ